MIGKDNYSLLSATITMKRQIKKSFLIYAGKVNTQYVTLDNMDYKEGIN